MRPSLLGQQRHPVCGAVRTWRLPGRNYVSRWRTATLAQGHGRFCPASSPSLHEVGCQCHDVPACPLCLVVHTVLLHCPEGQAWAVYGAKPASLYGSKMECVPKFSAAPLKAGSRVLRGLQSAPPHVYLGAVPCRPAAPLAQQAARYVRPLLSLAQTSSWSPPPDQAGNNWGSPHMPWESTLPVHG